MKLVVGLGNPGEKYINNRHNLGFMIVDAFVKQEGLEWKLSQDWVCYFAKDDEAVFVKPTTFMNRSGIAVRAVADFYKVDVKDILIIYDEVDLPFGKIRLSFDGLSAGHKGVESIIESTGGTDFGRVRVGIDRPSEEKTSNDNGVPRHVLEDFTKEEQKELEGIIKRSAEAVKSYLDDGIEATMNKFN